MPSSQIGNTQEGGILGKGEPGQTVPLAARRKVCSISVCSAFSGMLAMIGAALAAVPSLLQLAGQGRQYGRAAPGRLGGMLLFWRPKYSELSLRTFTATGRGEETLVSRHLWVSIRMSRQSPCYFLLPKYPGKSPCLGSAPTVFSLPGTAPLPYPL